MPWSGRESYGGPVSEAPTTANEEVYVLGGANSAGQAALHSRAA
jgi:hypothetical protein